MTRISLHESLIKSIDSGEVKLDEQGHLIGKVKVDEALAHAYPTSFSIRNYIPLPQTHITAINPVDDSVLIASQGKAAERRIGWSLSVSDFNEEAVRSYLSLRQSEACIDVVKDIHQKLIKLSSVLGKSKLCASYKNEVWTVHVIHERHEFNFIFSNSSLGRTYPIEWPDRIHPDIQAILTSPTDGYVTVID